MRTAFINSLIDLAHKDESVFLIVGDLGFSVVEPFQKAFPDRFLNAGVAEQNMVGIASGLAMEGYNVFVYSIANFPTLRAMEQIRYDVCYHNLSVNIVSVGGGFAYGSLGASHHATEDLGMMRTIPNIRVYSPGDPSETKLATEDLVNNPGPGYLRLGKAGEADVHEQLNHLETFIPVIQSGCNSAVIATGSILSYAKQTILELGKHDLYSCPLIKPLSLSALKSLLDNYDEIITLEEHQKSGGFGSAILEGINDLEEKYSFAKRIKVKRIAIEDQFYFKGGSQKFMRDLANLKIK